jgi:hypothetical protein
VLKQLIEEAGQIRVTCKKSSEIEGEYISGEKYEKWIAKAILWMEKNSPSKTLTKKFIDASEQAVENNESYLDTMVGILAAIFETKQETPDNKQETIKNVTGW